MCVIGNYKIKTRRLKCHISTTVNTFFFFFFLLALSGGFPPYKCTHPNIQHVCAHTPGFCILLLFS